MNLKHKIVIALSLVAVAIVSRFMPHLWNMTPIAAVGILAGARLGWKWGIALPVLAMVISDIFIGFYSLPILLSVYFSFALAGLVGFLVRKTGIVGVILGGSALSAAIFFFVTNTAVWQWGIMYPHTFSGLLVSYIAGLPFFQNQIIGDLFFTTTLFAVWELGSALAHRMKGDKLRTLLEKTI
jgi:hypothetical protein